MECNKDEALNAMQFAEQKMASKDMKGAQKLAMIAQKLFPGLNGLEKMLAVIEVCLLSENKIHGEPDWYKILGVDPVATDVALKQQYRRKLLLLHPDKNTFPSAPEAYDMFSAAWGVLSDESKKREYDKKLNIQSSNPRNNPSSPAERFWTSCNGCMLKLEYAMNFLNENRICPSCGKSFVAREMPAPERGSASGPTEMAAGSGSGGVKPTRKRKGQKAEDSQSRGLIRKAAADWISHLNALTPPGSGAP